MKYWHKKNKMQLLRGFCTVMEKGSILEASKYLEIAQSAVSVQVASLERDLEVPLFRRYNGRLIPLPEAHKLYKTARFELHNTTYEEGLELLETGNVDFVVFPAVKERLPSSISAKEFYKCKFSIGMAKSHPLAKVPEEEITWDIF